jgi:hypothetical protein
MEHNRNLVHNSTNKEFALPLNPSAKSSLFTQHNLFTATGIKFYEIDWKLQRFPYKEIELCGEYFA